MNRRVLAALLTLALATPALAQTPPLPPGSLQWLGNLGGDQPYSEVFAMSADGSALVGQTSTPTGYRAFRWTSATGFQTAPNNNSNAYDCSADGTISVGDALIANNTRATRWSGPFLTDVIPDLPGGATSAYAFGCSADGRTIVGDSSSTTGIQAFQWREGLGTRALGHLGQHPGGYFYSSASDVSADGLSIVGLSTSPRGTEAFRWTESGMQPLSDLPGGAFTSYAGAISRDASTIVGYGSTESGLEATRWTSAGIQGLGYLPGAPAENLESVANDLSADGSIIVGRSTSGGRGTAFIWTESQGMRSVQAILEDEFGHTFGGWSLVSVNAISDDGRTVAGYGWHNSRPEAFVATIPAPGALGASVVLAIGLQRRRR
ncbi:MAG: PEP-CTERM sorting domain-containing protein [Phycisphaerales bacterium]